MHISYQSDLAIHPGEYLEEILEEVNMDRAELSNKINEPKEAIEKIISGQMGIDPEIASNLEDALGIPTHIWIGIENEYNSIKDEVNREDEVK